MDFVNSKHQSGLFLRYCKKFSLLIFNISANSDVTYTFPGKGFSKSTVGSPKKCFSFTLCCKNSFPSGVKLYTESSPSIK